MIDAGIIDPVKVSRSALQTAASVASLILDDRSSRSQQNQNQQPQQDQEWIQAWWGDDVRHVAQWVLKHLH